jgi:hypothetical protein
MKSKNYTEEHILNSALIGIEFEFFSKIKIEKIAKLLAKKLNKRVVIPLAITELGNDPIPKYHSPVKTSGNIFKLEPDYSGGKEMFELITGPLEYTEAKKIIIAVFEWIEEFGYTTDKASIHINISFDKIKIKPKIKIENLNVLKFVLSFDESEIYKDFPHREQSVYARSIKNIIPNSIFFYNSIPNDLSIINMVNVANEKYFGINFTKAIDGYLEFRYIGGKGYEKKRKKIFKTINHFILSFFNVINQPEFTKNERDVLTKIFQQQRKIVQSINSYETFKENYKDIKISIDLIKNDEVIKSFWSKLTKEIFSLLTTSGLTKGKLNYDTDFGKCQLADAKLNNCNIKNFDLINCELAGIIINCELYSCKVTDSRVIMCDKVKDTEISKSKVKNTGLRTGNTCNDCFIDNFEEIINCKVNDGVIRKGLIGSKAVISDNTNIVEPVGDEETEEAKPVKVSKPRDWKWLKSLKKYNKK